MKWFRKRKEQRIDDGVLLRRYAALPPGDLSALREHLSAEELRRVIEQWDTAVRRFIRGRYQCDGDEVERVFDRWREFLCDALPVRMRFTDEGEADLRADLVPLFDEWAAEIALMPK